MQKIDHKIITGIIRLLSGTRISGSDDQLEIGGTDLTCIKDPVSSAPYIPGSSLKGKMRSELELIFALADGNEPLMCKKKIRDKGRDKWVSKSRGELRTEEYLLAALFGPHKNTDHQFGPTRVIVRDAHVRPECEWRLERKASTAIGRQTGAALSGSLRTEERVAPGAEFVLRIGVQVWDIDRDASNCSFNGKTGGAALLEFLEEGLRLVQKTGLGSGISKGSGEIEFRDLKLDGQPFTL